MEGYCVSMLFWSEHIYGQRGVERPRQDILKHDITQVKEWLKHKHRSAAMETKNIGQSKEELTQSPGSETASSQNIEVLGMVDSLSCRAPFVCEADTIDQGPAQPQSSAKSMARRNQMTAGTTRTWKVVTALQVKLQSPRRPRESSQTSTMSSQRCQSCPLPFHPMIHASSSVRTRCHPSCLEQCQ